MSRTYRDPEDRPLRARVHAAARVSVERLPDSGDALVKFEDDIGTLHVVLALEVFPRLVDIIQFAGLADTPATRPARRRVPPSGGSSPGLMVRKAPGDEDGA